MIRFNAVMSSPTSCKVADRVVDKNARIPDSTCPNTRSVDLRRVIAGVVLACHERARYFFGR